METKVVGGQDTRWKVLEGAWVMGMHGSEFRCCTEYNNIALAYSRMLGFCCHQCIVESVQILTKYDPLAH